MNRLNGVPRRLSVICTPFSMITLSNDIAPEIVVLPLGPVPWRPGARFTAELSVRAVASVFVRSDLMLVATVAVLTNASDRADTVTSSLNAGLIVTFSGTGCAAATSNDFFCVPKPDSSNVTVYVPGGTNGKI